MFDTKNNVFKAALNNSRKIRQKMLFLGPRALKKRDWVYVMNQI